MPLQAEMRGLEEVGVDRDSETGAMKARKARKRRLMLGFIGSSEIRPIA